MWLAAGEGGGSGSGGAACFGRGCMLAHCGRALPAHARAAARRPLSAPLAPTLSPSAHPNDAGRRDKLARGWTMLRGGAMPPRYRAAWSEYYERCQRDPGNTEPAPWIARRREQRRQRRTAAPSRGA